MSSTVFSLWSIHGQRETHTRGSDFTAERNTSGSALEPGPRVIASRPSRPGMMKCELRRTFSETSTTIAGYIFQGEVGRGTFSAYRPALERIGVAIKATFPVNLKHCLDHLHKPCLAFFPLLQTSLCSCQTPHLRTEKSREGGERGLALTMFQNSCCFSKLQNSNYFIAGDTLHACTTHFPLEGRLVHCNRRGMTTQGRTPHSFLSAGIHTFFPRM